MQELLALQRKNAVLLTLKESWADLDADESKPSLDEQASIADTVVALADAFGTSLLEHLRLLVIHAPRLSEKALQAAANAAHGSVRVGNAAAKPHAALLEEQIVRRSEEVQVTLEAVELAQSALEDFVGSYFMFHDMSPEHPADVMQYLPSLLFVESHIYAIDQANEDNLLPAIDLSGSERQAAEEAPLEDPFGPLRALLRGRGWLTPRMEAELADGARFWALERKLCNALRQRNEANANTVAFNRTEVETALRLKSFDYRVMNLLLYAMRHAPVQNTHLDFLATSEVLVEVGDDLVDYEEDVERNSFNIYRCFVALYGPERGASELRAFIASAEAEYSAKLSSLDVTLRELWQKRCQGVKRHGAGSERGPGGGNWDIPCALDESAVQSAACRRRTS